MTHFAPSYFSPEFFGEHFNITGEIVILPDGGSGSKGMVVNYDEMRRLKLKKEDEEILEFIVAWTMSRE